jgi:NADH-quinone oxidoreductase subunit N
MLNDFLLVLPEEILSVGAMILMLAAAWGGDRAAPVLTWLAVLVIAVAGLFLPGIANAGGSAFGGLFVADNFAAFSKILVFAGAAVAMLMAMSWFGRDRDYRAEYPVLILFAVLGMSIMISASDLLTLYVGLELQSLAAYVLASFQRSDARSAEAGLKYFVLGALASGILLYGISLLYGFTGTTC